MTNGEPESGMEAGASESQGSGAQLRNALGWLMIALVVVAADQATKLLIIDQLALYQRVQVLPFFDIVRLHNTGAAFSFLADAAGWQNILFMMVAVAISGGILIWLLRYGGDGRTTLALGLTLILGGAIGNVIDRMLYGYVVDFLLFFYGQWSYPAFNVADAAITCGAALVLYDGFVLERRRMRTAR